MAKTVPRMGILYRFPKMESGEAQPKQACYFMIGYGPALRWSGKFTDVREACCEAFGMSVENMRGWNLGTRIDVARKLARQITL